MSITERKYETEFHNKVEELTGTYPSADTLRNAVFAILDAGRSAIHGPESRSEHSPMEARHILESIEIFARKYETTRGISMEIIDCSLGCLPPDVDGNPLCGCPK